MPYEWPEPDMETSGDASMVRICPVPPVWASLHQQLQKHAASRACVPAAPPVPLILGGWIHSNDVQKQARWAETLAWADANGAGGHVAALHSTDFYEVEYPSSVDIGPTGGPMYLPWSFKRKPCPEPGALAACMARLRSAWPETAGPDIAPCTAPVAFTGAKARRLLVAVTGYTSPPWGDWARLPADAQRRRVFTRLRAAINGVVSPHQVDHVDFEAARSDVPACELRTRAGR
jgi:hypothetical protein